MFSDRGACKVSMVLEYLDMDLYRLMRSHPQLLPANPALVKVRGDFCSTLSTLSLCHSVTLSLCHSVTLSLSLQSSPSSPVVGGMMGIILSL